MNYKLTTLSNVGHVDEAHLATVTTNMKNLKNIFCGTGKNAKSDLSCIEKYRLPLIMKTT